ncbi:sugar-binding transcriptional regulator [Xylocopilactobacillus apicola]|uniref:DNA-binding transcriptional regulator n=1 Tax=Xylocopilactobacillus apicola TaxID=2932184 RepID=A0AAU9D5T3_9LACO|nr:sugar-binding domain-containing protein [Xylocopilactobacillus apicola]BDR59184.1 DNA-binding transcriptional regulator [Xylocopilactobacillus apicola]
MKNRQLLARVAYQYYIQNKTQAEIANNLDLGRSTISRLLSEARRENIVSIQINDLDLLELEVKVKEAFNLRNVIIVTKSEAIAHEAALYLKQIIKPNNRVGVAWGSTLARMVGQLQHPKSTNATFIPLVGGPSAANSKYNVNTIVYDLARKFVGKSAFINATAVQESAALRNCIMNSKDFAEFAYSWEHLDIALVGVGGPLTNKTTSHWRDLLTTDDLVLLKEQHAIGDCCCTFFNEDGKILAPELQKRTIAIPLSMLSRVPISIALASSLSKVPSIKALLSMGIVNTLITDQETAINLLKR